MIYVLARGANTTVIDIAPNGVTHFMLDSLVLGKRLGCTKGRPRTSTKIAFQHELNWFVARCMPVQAGLYKEQFVNTRMPFISFFSHKFKPYKWFTSRLGGECISPHKHDHRRFVNHLRLVLSKASVSCPVLIAK